MAGTTLKLVDPSGNVLPLMVTNTGAYSPIVCRSWDIGSPAHRENVSEVPGQNGVTDRTLYTGARTVTLELTVRDGTLAPYGTLTRHQWLDKLRALTNPRLRPSLYIQAQGWPQERRIDLRATPLTSVVDSAGIVHIPATMTFQGGNMVGVNPVSGSIYPGTTTGGRSYPRSYPWSYSAGTASNISSVTNEGTDWAYVQMTIFGLATNPKITNRTTGQVLKFSDLVVPAGQYMDIDMADRTALMNGSSSFYGNIDMSVSSWWSLAPGVNDIMFESESSDDFAHLQFSFSPVWS